ncbi:hypothetical protein E4P36_09755 [Streptomyces sp. 4R-3d]|nr:hypothetical protein E4P36_09755 [Streptomyces sp. 4R-3d]
MPRSRARSRTCAARLCAPRRPRSGVRPRPRCAARRRRGGRASRRGHRAAAEAGPGTGCCRRGRSPWPGTRTPLLSLPPTSREPAGPRRERCCARY